MALHLRWIDGWWCSGVEEATNSRHIWKGIASCVTADAPMPICRHHCRKRIPYLILHIYEYLATRKDLDKHLDLIERFIYTAMSHNSHMISHGQNDIIR